MDHMDCDDHAGGGARRPKLVHQVSRGDDELGRSPKRHSIPPIAAPAAGAEEAAAAFALLRAASSSPHGSSPHGPPADAWAMPPTGPAAAAASAADRPPIAAFTRTLFQLLEGPRDETHCDWSDAGRRIVFTNPRLFGEQVCPRHFRHSEWTSFARMLNLYGFKKMSRTPRLGSAASRAAAAQVFEHPHFSRDSAELHLVARRTKKKASAADDAAAARAAEIEAMRTAEIESHRAPVVELERRLSKLEVENASLRARLRGYEGDVDSEA
mmetsp:Transcript_12216/g.37644  ORF Transcript_12216/g.37644 Transcript_12216/m.37644 type:complete len:269 (+) Transcript_12216:311-1117(+)